MLQIVTPYLSKIASIQSDQKIVHQLSLTYSSGLRKNNLLDQPRNRFPRKRSRRLRTMTKTKRYSSRYPISSFLTGMKKGKTVKHRNSQLTTAKRVVRVAQLLM